MANVPNIVKLVADVTDKTGKVVSGTIGAVTSRVKSLAKNVARKAIAQVTYAPPRSGRVSGVRKTKGEKRTR